jgi:maltooligosyltrehalose trehalohydrolase
MRLGCDYKKAQAKAHFRVWAPNAESLEIVFANDARAPIPMAPQRDGYWSAAVGDLQHGTKYWYRLNRTVLRPDPASHAQPDGVHGPSQVVNHHLFRWHDKSWKGMPLEKMVIYELHVGTFTPEGTFDAIIPRVAELRSAGISAIELMPIAQFPGHRNWGYDGTYPYAVQSTYGGPEGLKRLVDACHGAGLAVLLDVVYNHLGPEGNYLSQYGPYFSDRYGTPWGEAVNFDGAGSREVRTYFIENALHWFTNYHIDGLRLDAVHAIFDQSAIPFLRQLSESAARFKRQTGRRVLLIAESDLNDPRMIRKPERGGFGLDAQWSDDFHHSMHALLTGERAGYYADFGEIQHLASALRDGFVYAGQYSQYRKRIHGDSVLDRPPGQLVIACQTHDQVGNRKHGERLSTLVSFEALKASRALQVLSPYIPLFFMGEEYAEDRPFLYFVSHNDAALVEAVRRGRRDEFARFRWDSEPPDPQDPGTFVRSMISWDDRTVGHHHTMLHYTKTLLTLRRTIPAFRALSRESMNITVGTNGKVLVMHRRKGASQAAVLCNLDTTTRSPGALLPKGAWRVVLDSSDSRWGGPGSALPQLIKASNRIRLAGLSAVVLLR